MDNKDKVGSPDRELINIHENYEVEYWAEKLGVTASRLREAVQKAGNSVAAVKAYLNN
ncbi:DUF3606 domain-containing protein [Mucilaginibacter sp. UR6-11]|uniref:DUF3606 domain-containing protein n=1 Tax=Mucilaginibacter sp. UR6-11 TaxID=1435644 RepID=UPI001E628F63|nr:DUF3606 domain-containing protein [Mucilaginibacter sp. UR6-11]MCC8426722.1 DUF3606 domain-containing protein [Mucilaginibacter sp. UR6-11]